MSKRLPNLITSFEHNYYLDEDVFKMTNKLVEESKQLKEEIEEYKRIEQEDLKAFNNYDSILTELKDTLEEKLKSIDYLKETLKENVKVLNPYIDGIELAYKDIQKVIQELKEKYK